MLKSTDLVIPDRQQIVFVHQELVRYHILTEVIEFSIFLFVGSTMVVDGCIRDAENSSESNFSLKGTMPNEDAYDLSHLISSLNLSTATTSLDSLNSMQSVFELDGNYDIVLQGRIGQVSIRSGLILHIFI